MNDLTQGLLIGTIILIIFVFYQALQIRRLRREKIQCQENGRTSQIQIPRSMSSDVHNLNISLDSRRGFLPRYKLGKKAKKIKTLQELKQIQEDKK